ncbi:unnamed protein product [Peronospora belbahrii]|uniref:EF-hand domain-containing protein n=1 Tax=Peronospora belbahrii TaxID=622444 RepID=A0ABN8CUS5_9STRA|nr:unnamed protein product [Peronospora belbahrii]
MVVGSLFQVGVDVELWRVLIHLSILALCLIFFEAALHHIEHKLAQYDKYQQMLRKAYRELMILGLLSLGLKLLKEMPGVNAESKTMLAFQVADLTIFILALALILQAIIVFSQLRKHNKAADRIELITAQDLVNAISLPAGTPPTSAQVHTNSTKWWVCWPRNRTKLYDQDVVQRRLLRHLFLRRFGLPQLFPFSKYLRRAQASQISHMIEIEPSTWILLLTVAWMLCGLLSAFHSLDVDLPESHELVEVFLIFAWGLVLLHIMVLLFFRSCVRQLLLAAGYSDNEATLAENLRAIAEEEDVAWQNEAADSALSTMNRVQEELEEIEDSRNAKRHVLLRRDVGLQLVATCYRNLNQIGAVKLHRLESGVQSESPNIHIRFFSRKAWHVAVMFMLILNGFFTALLVQCAVYDLDEIYKDFGLFHAIVVPLPLFLNTFVFQQQMFRYFVTVCSILRVDAHTLGEVVNHFSEIVELRSEFASSLLECLKGRDFTIMDLRNEISVYDPRQTGMIDIDRLHSVLMAFGFRLTRFRFNSVAMMLFRLNGTRVEYSQLLRLLMLGQHDTPNECGPVSERRQYPLLLQRRRTYSEDCERLSLQSNRVASLASRHVSLLPRPSVMSEPRPGDFFNLNTPGLHRLSIDIHTNVKSENGCRRAPMLDRNYTHQLAGTSSRTLRNMLFIRTELDSQAESVPSDTMYTVV